MAESLNKNFSGSAGSLNLSGSNVSAQFYTTPTSLNIAAGNFSLDEMKSGAAKSSLVNQAKSTINNLNRSIQTYDKVIQTQNSIINNPNSTQIEINTARTRLAEAQEEQATIRKEIQGTEAALSYFQSGLQSDLDSLASKVEVPPTQTTPGNDGTATGSTEQEEVTEPDPDATSNPGDNSSDDDGTPPATPGENQEQETLPESGAPTSVSTGGSGQGSAASPGNAGVGGADLLPGRRTYNPLSKLASYTYNLTLYMITPDAYDAFVLSGRRKIDALSQASPIGGGGGVGAGAFIIAQSGGINNKTQTRAPGFELDYYIDNVSFTTITSQNQLQASAFTGTLKMTITEPYGFSFLSNLRRALEGLKSYASATGYKEMTNALNQFFVLGIRFYGYDNNGNLIKGTDPVSGEPLDPENGTEALFERFYDLSLSSLKFQLTAKGGTSYNIDFGTVSGDAMLGTKRGRIQTGARVVGSKVKDMLIGTDGLLTKLNKEQEDQVNKKVRSIPNTFDVKFMGEAEQRIADASMVLDSDLLKYRWPGSSAQNTSNVTDNAGIKAIPDSNARELIFNNDTLIIRAIGNIIMKSEFMEKALKTVYNNVVQPDPKQKAIVQTINNEPQKLSWYNISAQVTEPKWDTLINDWAYKTTFIITLYEIPSITTPFSNNSEKYYGPHKYFYYWLTGQNSEVVDFQLTFNNTYYNTVVQTPPGGADVTGLPAGTNTGRTAIAPMTQSGGDTTGSVGVGGAAQAAVETSVYDPQAFTDGKITILGDPDFIMRDQATGIDSLYQKFYDTDQFTASAHGGMVYVEVVLKEAQDYKHSVGLQQVNESIQFYPYPKSVRDVAKGIIYRVDKVTSNFMSGKFIQTLIIRGADEWPGEESQETASDSTREQEAQTSTSGGSTSGASSGSGTGTTDSTGLRAEPKAPVEKPASLADSQPLTNTIGNETPGTVDTDTGQVADDDSLSSDSITFTNITSREEDGGREFVDEVTIPTRVKVDPIGPPNI